MVDAVPRQESPRKLLFRRPALPLLVFTDLDGTLLDHHSYSFAAALPALQRLRELNIPVVPVSSKTLAELAPLMRELGNPHPCIAENGGLIAVPPDYFAAPDAAAPLTEGYRVLGAPSRYDEIRRTAQRLRAEQHYQFRGFGDMSAEDVADCTGLSTSEATLAKRRLCSEPLLWLDTGAALDHFREALEETDLQLVQGGRFFHLMGRHDKASAIRELCEHYRSAGFSDFRTLGLGDSPNDIPMLQAVDAPILIRRPDGSCLSLQTDHPACCSESPGPEGWNQSVLQVLDAAAAGTPLTCAEIEGTRNV
jgi:mannosyl-3-phosphoglycerate phosphatase